MPVMLPETVDEALKLKAADPSIVPMAGGTDLLVQWPERLDRHEVAYLDLSGITELRTARWTDQGLELGALTTFWDTLSDPEVGRRLPLLHEAARQVGAVQIQARGTWAGNIANASPAADGVAVLMAYDATVVLASSQGERRIALRDFYVDYKKTSSRPDELITRILVPAVEYDFEAFEKVAPRRAQAITVVGVAVTHSAAGWRVVAASMAPTVCRCRHLEELLDGAGCPSRPEDLLVAQRLDVAPIDDIRSTARYRERVMSRVLFHALRTA